MTGHLHVIVMGVSGTGKSTVAQGISDALGLQVAEGDDFHPPANIAKMSAGVPLDDDDRRPWLTALATWTGERHAEGTSTVVTCSALKRSYRDILRSGVPEPTVFVHLVGSRAVLEERMSSRAHFMPVSLLDSQLATLEALDPDEDGLVVDTDQPVADVVATVVSRLRGRAQ
jgi:gluconokinase